MSVQATTWVWNHSKAQGIDKLVLLALADHAHPDGSHAYPSVASLARMATVSERTVQRSLRHLTDMGEIQIVRHAHHHATTEYQLTTWGDNLTPQDDSGVTETPSGVTNDAIRGDTAMSPKPNNPEPTRAPARAYARARDDTPTPIPPRLSRHSIVTAKQTRTPSEDVTDILTKTRQRLHGATT